MLVSEPQPSGRKHSSPLPHSVRSLTVAARIVSLIRWLNPNDRGAKQDPNKTMMRLIIEQTPSSTQALIGRKSANYSD